jgi:hypothetical protein
MQLHIADEASFVPAMRQLDHRLAAIGNVAVEDHVLDLAIAEDHFDAVELDVLAADQQLEPLELAVMPAGVDYVAVVAEADIAVAEPDSFAGLSGADGKERQCKCHREFSKHDFSVES